MKLKVLVAACALLAPLATNAQSWTGPFGLQMGLSVQDLESAIPDLKRLAPDSYTFTKAPHPYPGITHYAVDIGSTTGVCKISAMAVVDSPSSGDAVKSKFNELKKSITSKYGNATASYDVLRQGSDWDDLGEWMTSLAVGDRTLSSYWIGREDLKNSLTLPPDMSGISLSANGASATRAAVIISYEFTNFETCANEAKSRTMNAL